MKYPPIDDAPVRRTDPFTSHLAAALLPTGVLEKMFVDALPAYPHTLTTTEIARCYGMERDSFSPRPGALKRKGLIVQDGWRLVPNKAGHLRRMIAFRRRHPTDTSPDMTPLEQRVVSRKVLRARVVALETALRAIVFLSDKLTDGDKLLETIDAMDELARGALEQGT
jgi:hypothetical protein